jgi:FAD/FMN-containing dehydrogenase
MIDALRREELKTKLVMALGEPRVLCKEADLLPYAKDTYRIRFDEEFKYLPDAVVFPDTTTDVQKVVQIAAEIRVPIIPKGGGSNRTGMLVPIHGGIVVDTIRMNRIVEISAPNLYVTVQPGITLKELEERLFEHGLALNRSRVRSESPQSAGLSLPPDSAGSIRSTEPSRTGSCPSRWCWRMEASSGPAPRSSTHPLVIDSISCS